MYLGLSYVLTLRKATMLIAFSGDSLEKLEERKIRLDMNIWRKKNKTHKLVVVVYVLSSSCQYLRVCVHSCLSVLNNFRVCPWWILLEKTIKNLSYLWNTKSYVLLQFHFVYIGLLIWQILNFFLIWSFHQA